jgi:hypothetical protein
MQRMAWSTEAPVETTAIETCGFRLLFRGGTRCPEFGSVSTTLTTQGSPWLDTARNWLGLSSPTNRGLCLLEMQMLGTIIGDIAGSAYEFINYHAKDFQPFFHQKARLTDEMRQIRKEAGISFEYVVTFAEINVDEIDAQPIPELVPEYVELFGVRSR